MGCRPLEIAGLARLGYALGWAVVIGEQRAFGVSVRPAAELILWYHVLVLGPPG